MLINFIFAYKWYLNILTNIKYSEEKCIKFLI